jgi:hypothetical protein
MREAVTNAYFDLTGRPADFIFSGWGAYLTRDERDVVEAAERNRRAAS